MKNQMNVDSMSLKLVLEELCKFVDTYKVLLNTHNVQFLVDNHWHKFIVSNPNLHESLIKNVNEHETLLKYLNNEINLDTFDDDPVKKVLKNMTDLNNLWKTHVLTDINLFDLEENDIQIKLKEDYVKSTQIKHVDRFMNEKKKHEVDEMSYLIAKLCKYCDINTLIDVGSGRGYLSTQLNSIYNLNVVAIDSSTNNVNSSLKRIETMKKHTNLSMNEVNFQTFNEFIKIDTELNELILKRLNVNLSQTNYGIIGLHSCGNLSSSMIDIYLRNSMNQASLLCNVPCCYHLINEKYTPNEFDYINENDDDGVDDRDNDNNDLNKMKTFPMCSLLNNSNYFIGRNARMLSSQPLDRHLSNNQINDRGLWYRCVLQVILKEKFNIYGVNIKVGKLAPKCKNFIEYVQKALKKLNLDNSLINEEEIDDYWKKYENDQANFNYYYQFKILFAPLIEYIILLDRLIYLNEKNNLNFLKNYIVQLFEPVKSPRCFALISFKNKIRN